jgi:hypothetical protein
MAASHDALGNVSEADMAYEHALTVARQRGAAHEIAFTVAAMTQRKRRAGLRVDESLLAEVRPLQRRLGLLLDLTAGESTTEPSTEPSTSLADRLGFAAVPATA